MSTLFQLRQIARAIIPTFLFDRLLSAYHFAFAWLGALLYGRPGRRLIVVGVTGTKGKTSVTELIAAILEEAGHKTALVNSIRFKMGEESEANPIRMSMPGRFFLQGFLARARRRDCKAAVLEMTSEGARQHRHRFLDMDALVFMNLAPEHIESHGSLEAYADAKFSIGKELERSSKRPRTIVANADDKEGARYLTLAVENAVPFSLAAAKPYSADDRGGFFTFRGTRVSLKLPGEFSLENALAAAELAHALGIPAPTIARALGKIETIPGRGERVEAGQDFAVVVDYAHTPESLRAICEAYRGSRKICIIGSTGGGRDAWKRPAMGRIGEELCETVILTNEDPYDEDPRRIVEDIARGMERPPEIIMDRRAAIARALELAQAGDAVLITGKGTNHEICGPHGSMMPWSDAEVAREEIGKLFARRGI